MSHKRQQDDFKANPSEDKRRKLPSLRNVILEVMSLRKVQLCMEPVLEPLIRKVVKEEVELALRKYLTNMKWSIGKEIESSESRSLQLQFLPKISLPIFTGSRIEGEDCNTLKVALVDGLTGQIVYSGLESSAKVEIVVLEGDFDGDEGGNWTLEEFNNNIVRERVGKKPLLTGDLIFALEEGFGLVGEIYFTDNSSWTRSRKFRLGARVVDSFEGVRVREAKTESFIVRDHRGELYKKHHPPSLHDEVWRLEKIGKDGAFHKRLNLEKVNSVKDFLILLFLDPTRLRNILGTGMSTKMWEVTIEHAQTCILDPRLYFYCPGSQQKTGVVFSVVGQVMGLLADCQYIPLDKLSETEKEEAHNTVIAAFTKWEKVVSFDDEASLINASGSLFSYVPCANTADNKVLTSEKLSGSDYPQASLCSPDAMPSAYSMEHVNILDDFGLHDIDHLDLTYDESINFNGQATNSLFCEPEDDRLQYIDADCSFQSGNSHLESDLHSAVNGFLLPRSAAFAQRRWTMVFSVLKWFSIRKIVAKKTRSINFNGQAANSLFFEPEDDRLQYFGADCSFQSGNSRFESDLHSAVNGFLLPRSTAFAQRKWTMLFSVLKWFSIRKIVAKKTRSINFNGQAANSLFFEPEDDRLQYFGADCSFQSGNSRFESDLHSAVNGFLLPRSTAFAQRRWTMLFSVLKWFSIRKIVAKKTHVRRKQRFC